MNVRTGKALLRGESGVSAVEFALSLPVLLAIGGYGVEVANLALTQLRVSQAALYLADTASRVGLTSALTTKQLRESDINDVYFGLAKQGEPIKLTTYGRITLSSLEGRADGTQWLHWQRCIGANNKAGYGSNWDAGTGTAGVTVTSMGDSGAPVKAPANSGVMFVEINYDYRPLFGTTYVAAQKIRYTASYIIRDQRDFTQVYSPGTKADCKTTPYLATANKT